MPPLDTAEEQSSHVCPAPTLSLQLHSLDDAGVERFARSMQAHLSLRQCLEEVWRALRYDAPEAPACRKVTCLTLVVRPMDGVAHTAGAAGQDDHKQIHLAAGHIARCHASDDAALHEIKGVLWHEMVHVLQHDGRGTVPGGLIEGIADWVRLKCGLAPPHWARTPGPSWDAGYEKTAYFLVWVSDHVGEPHFVPLLNAAFATAEWENGAAFRTLCNGQTVEELWAAYLKSFDGDRTAAPPARPTAAARP